MNANPPPKGRSPALRWSFFDGGNFNRPQKREGAWSDFVAMIRQTWKPARTQGAPSDIKKSVPSFSPAVFQHGTTRAKENAEALHFLGLDFDNAGKGDPVTVAEIADRLRSGGFAAAIYTTWSHTPARPKFRVVLPLASPVSPKDWHQVSESAIAMLGLDPWRDALDLPALKDPARLFFLPAVLDPSMGILREFLEGVPLDLSTVPVKSAPARQPASSPLPMPPVPESGDRPNPEARYAAYLSRVEGSIAGKGGNAEGGAKTLRDMAHGTRGFRLPEETVFAIALQDYNPRCVPPWKPEDLRRKVCESLKCEVIPWGKHLHEGERTPDWHSIREGFERGERVPTLAKAHFVKSGAIWDRAKAENWKTGRKRAQEAPGAAGASPPVESTPPEPSEASVASQPREGGHGKRSASDLVISLALTSGAEFWATPEEEPYVTVPIPAHGSIPAHVEHYSLLDGSRTGQAGSWLRQIYFKATKKGLEDTSLATVRATLAAHALYSHAVHAVHLRTANTGDAAYVDLGTPDWSVVEVVADGWAVRPASDVPVRFRRTRHMLALPVPERCGNLEELRAFLNTDDRGFISSVAFLVASLFGRAPFPLLVINGEPGSGKSTGARVLHDLIDPHRAVSRSAPETPEDLWTAARNAYALNFGNLSSIPAPISDNLCSLLDGAAYARRARYTDSDEAITAAARPVILEGIPNLLRFSDLADRASCITLQRIQCFRDETLFNAELNQARPRILGAIFDALAGALGRLPGRARTSEHRRGGFAALIEAAEPDLPWEPGSFMAIYRDSKEEGAADRIQSDPFARTLLELAKERQELDGCWSFEGTPSDFYTAMCIKAGDSVRQHPHWPKAVNKASERLRRIAIDLRHVGFSVEVDLRTPGGLRERFFRLSYG